MGSFIKSARFVSEYFQDRRPQVCLIGRSNVGKSSLVNALANDRKLAKTSSTPGHTKLVNFFDLGRFVLVDLPGYGYQKGSDSLDDILIEYLNYGHNTTCTLQLCNVDVVTEADKQMSVFLEKMPAKHLIVLTKSDRISPQQLKQNTVKIAQYLKVKMEQIIPISTKKRTNIDHLLAVVNAICREPKRKEQSTDGKEI